MKPFDPRLVRHAHRARGVLIAGGVLGLIRSCAIVVWCWCLAQAISIAALPVLGGAGGAAGRIAEGALAPAQLPTVIAVGAAAVIIRSAATWAMDVVAARGAVRVKAELREVALDVIDAQPLGRGAHSDSRLTTALGRGLDALDGYFTGYLPQLILTVIATPLFVLAVLLADPVSGVVVLIVFPIIPIFMILIGLATQSVQERQWNQLQMLAASFLDVVAGLPTLKIFGRESRQRERIAHEADEYRSRTMQVLRVTFLSGFVMDLAGTFSIALVAVTVGTRIVVGEFPLALGLFVLLLLPETFIPIRQVGAAFHASTEGMTAAAEVFEIIEQPVAAASEAPGGSVDGAVRGLSLVDVRIERAGGQRIGPVTFAVDPGECVALAGPSGIGKSTVISALIGGVAPSSGALMRPRAFAWAGQRPGLLQGSILENLALGSGDPDPGLASHVLAEVGLSHLDLHTALGAGGAGVSGGQAQRLAIARALYRARSTGAEALILDEPTSALDTANELMICDVLRREARAGRAVLVVSHREAVLNAADRIVHIGAEVLA